MTIEVDPAVARGVAGRLRTESDELFNLESEVRLLRSEAVLDDHGADALTELHEAHPELSSLANLMRLWADRLETTDANLASQLDKQIAAAFGAFYARVVRDGVRDPTLTKPLPGESNEEYLVRITAATTELRLRQLKLLKGQTTPYYDEWLLNAARNGVHSDQVIKIADECNIVPSDFDVLNGQERVVDNDGKSFFLIGPDLTVEERMKAVEMTYVLNAGTGYETANGHQHNDFQATPYSADEVTRIRERIAKNRWTYGSGPHLTTVSQIYQTGGAIAVTPNGMMIATRGKSFHVPVPADVSSRNGGTTYGDLFVLPDKSSDPAGDLRSRIASGHAGVKQGLDTDRLLHHEEIHSQQWASLGPARFAKRYLEEEVRRNAIEAAIWYVTKGRYSPNPNAFEDSAGLSDGGYAP